MAFSKDIISIVNKIQSVCARDESFMEFDLPQIAVIGSQSAGKTSVLEHVVGRY